MDENKRVDQLYAAFVCMSMRELAVELEKRSVPPDSPERNAICALICTLISRKSTFLAAHYIQGTERGLQRGSK